MIDARTIKSLAVGEHLTIPDCIGLRIKASSTGRSWIYRYKSPVDGRMKQTKLGEFPALSIAAAIAEWEKLRLVVKGGEDIAAEKKAAKALAIEIAVAHRSKKSAYKVRDVCNDWVRQLTRTRKEKGVKEVARLFDRMLGDFAELDAAKVTRSAAFDLIDSRANTPVVASYLKYELAAAWDHALDAGRLPESAANWWRQIMRGKLRSKGKIINGVHQGSKIEHCLTQDELATLINWLPNFSRTITDLLTMYIWTGCRGAEIVQMEISELSYEDGVLWWTIPKHKTKNARHEQATDHRVSLIGRARSVVERRTDLYKAGYIFPSVSSTAKVPHFLQKNIGVAIYYHLPHCKLQPKSIRPRLTVTGWAAHDLRRTTRTVLASIGCPDEVAEAILGHMKAGVKGIYNKHQYDKERLHWLTLLDAKLEELAAH